MFPVITSTYEIEKLLAEHPDMHRPDVLYGLLWLQAQCVQLAAYGRALPARQELRGPAALDIWPIVEQTRCIRQTVAHFPPTNEQRFFKARVAYICLVACALERQMKWESLFEQSGMDGRGVFLDELRSLTHSLSMMVTGTLVQGVVR